MSLFEGGNTRLKMTKVKLEDVKLGVVNVR